MDIFVIIIQDNQKWGKYFVEYTKRRGQYSLRRENTIYFLSTIKLQTRLLNSTGFSIGIPSMRSASL